MTRRFWVISLCSVALTAGIGLALAREQTQGTGRSAAEQAWRAGQYEEVEKLTAAQPADAAMVLLRAKSAAAVGDYARAESLLQPLAAKAPGSEAAVELGRLQIYQGKKAEARKTLQLILLAAQDAETVRDFLSASRAARALGQSENAKEYLQDASSIAPDSVE